MLLIVDEVQSGMGRTGRMWATEHSGVVPDIICMAKAIGGGLPLGVTLAREELMRWKPGAHASTFGGNPVAIAAALKTIELLEGGLIENAARVGGYLLERLRSLTEKHQCIAEVRGLGLMIGIEFVRDRKTLEPWPETRDAVVTECFNKGLVVQGAGESTVRLSPPLLIDREQADFAASTLDKVIADAVKS